MRVSTKLVLLIVCALAGSVFGLGKASKEEKMKVKEEAKEVQVEAKPAAPAAEPAPAPAAKPAEPKPAQAGADKDIAVTVNGKAITETEVDEKLKPIIARMAARMDPNSIEMYKSRVRGQALEGMIMEQILDEEVKKAGIAVTEKDINDKIGEILAQQGMTMEGMRQMLQMQGQTEEQMRQQMHRGLTYEKLMELKAGEADINDAETLAFYEKNKEDFNNPEQVQASHILVKVEPSATPEEKAAAKAKIEKLLKQVKTPDANFAQLARENSDCPSKAKGGDLGYFGRGQMVKEFEDTAFAMKPGQISGVIETQFGYHIIKVTDRKEAGMTPFDKAKDDIKKNLQQMKKNQLFREYIKKLRDGANIVYPPGKEPPPAPAMPVAPRSAPAPAAPAPK